MNLLVRPFFSKATTSRSSKYVALKHVWDIKWGKLIKMKTCLKNDSVLNKKLVYENNAFLTWNKLPQNKDSVLTLKVQLIIHYACGGICNYFLCILSTQRGWWICPRGALCSHGKHSNIDYIKNKPSGFLHI